MKPDVNGSSAPPTAGSSSTASPGAAAVSEEDHDSDVMIIGGTPGVGEVAVDEEQQKSITETINNVRLEIWTETPKFLERIQKYRT